MIKCGHLFVRNKRFRSSGAVVGCVVLAAVMVGCAKGAVYTPQTDNVTTTQSLLKPEGDGSAVAPGSETTALVIDEATARSWTKLFCEFDWWTTREETRSQMGEPTRINDVYKVRYDSIDPEFPNSDVYEGWGLKIELHFDSNDRLFKRSGLPSSFGDCEGWRSRSEVDPIYGSSFIDFYDKFRFLLCRTYVGKTLTKDVLQQELGVPARSIRNQKVIADVWTITHMPEDLEISQDFFAIYNFDDVVVEFGYKGADEKFNEDDPYVGFATPECS